MCLPHPRSTLIDTLFPYPTFFRSRVAARAADDRVVERVAIAGKIGGAAADQLFEIAGERVAVQRRFDPVEPGARRLGDPVAGVVDEEDVVARGAKPRIRRRSGGAGKQSDIFGRVGHGPAPTAGQSLSVYGRAGCGVAGGA